MIRCFRCSTEYSDGGCGCKDGITLVHGDCREVLPRLDRNCVLFDLLVSDPPYGINHTTSHGASWEGTTIQGDESTELRDWALNWAGDMPWAVFGIWKQQLPRGTKACLIWDKGPAFGCGDLRFPWKPSWEQIYIGGTGWKGKRDEGVLRGECVVSWESKGRMHPHQKPVWLYERLLAKQPEAKVVIDPFAGIGPCGLAGKRLGKKCVLVEIEERYCEIAANRLRQGCLL